MRDSRNEKNVKSKRRAGGLMHTLLIFMIFLQAIEQSWVYLR
ncbi:hypothetical protein ACPV4H_08730 [Vibrio rotiferianus]